MTVRDHGHNTNTQDPDIDTEPPAPADWEFWTTHFPWDPAEEDGGWAPNPVP
jgi:hypothetical protein